MPDPLPGFGPDTYGESFADVYDEWYGDISDAGATAAFVAARCGTGPIVELGVGTGRLVGPLASTAAGARHGVIGVDASSAMLERCAAAHPGVPLVRADLAALPLGAPIGAALCAFNTLFNLSSQGQTDLFGALGRGLADDGVVVIEALTGAGLDEGPGSSVGVSRLTATDLVLSATVVDAAAQTIRGQHVDISADGIRMRPWSVRWTTPDQLDTMAAAGGLALVERFENVEGDAYGPGSTRHVSVYRRA